MAFVYSHTCGCSRSPATTLPRPHQQLLSTPPRSFSPTTFQPSLAGGRWKGLRIAHPSSFESSRKLCKLLKGDAAGERAFDDDEGGESCDGSTSWLHYLMDQAGIDISHAQVSNMVTSLLIDRIQLHVRSFFSQFTNTCTALIRFWCYGS